MKGKDMPENRLPEEFKSIAEIQNFWGTHSSADYWDEMEDVDLQLSSALQAKLELKKLYRLLSLSSEQIAAIESKAKIANMNSKQLISTWVLEHV
ncbi:BrnA antitoxin family protein [candidate division KSB1 bacterium]|nr:BrnA antitoxin family protein [candidate division KSB1 bacterium]